MTEKNFHRNPNSILNCHDPFLSFLVYVPHFFCFSPCVFFLCVFVRYQSRDLIKSIGNEKLTIPLAIHDSCTNEERKDSKKPTRMKNTIQTTLIKMLTTVLISRYTKPTQFSEKKSEEGRKKNNITSETHNAFIPLKKEFGWCIH